MPDVAAFCPGCGRRMIDAPAALGRVGFLSENVAGALAYVTFIPPIIFLWRNPFRQNHFVRFHSLQSIFLVLAGVVVAIALRLAFFVLSLLPKIGLLLASLVVLLAAIAWFILWLVTLVKALQGELFKLPVIGGLAERM